MKPYIALGMVAFGVILELSSLKDHSVEGTARFTRGTIWITTGILIFMLP